MHVLWGAQSSKNRWFWFCRGKGWHSAPQSSNSFHHFRLAENSVCQVTLECCPLVAECVVFALFNWSACTKGAQDTLELVRDITWLGGVITVSWWVSCQDSFPRKGTEWSLVVQALIKPQSLTTLAAFGGCFDQFPSLHLTYLWKASHAGRRGLSACCCPSNQGGQLATSCLLEGMASECHCDSGIETWGL